MFGMLILVVNPDMLKSEAKGLKVKILEAWKELRKRISLKKILGANK